MLHGVYKSSNRCHYVAGEDSEFDFSPILTREMTVSSIL